jgi:predicted RNA-binding Zn-ribbon protein involved in translation (DUF1610 family)
MKKGNDKIVGKMSEETLRHFNCGACGCWWTIGDPRKKQKEWYCPWCGVKQAFKILPVSWLKEK